MPSKSKHVPSRAWHPQTLFARGRLTPERFAAARQLRQDYEISVLGARPCSSPDLNIDGSHRTQSVIARVEARDRYHSALQLLMGPTRAVVKAVVIEGRLVADAAAGEAVTGLAPGACASRLEAGAIMLLAAGLDQLAVHYRIHSD